MKENNFKKEKEKRKKEGSGFEPCQTSVMKPCCVNT